MRADLLHALAALPRLDPANAISAAVPCKMCGLPARFFDLVDFNKCPSGYWFGPSGIPVSWFRCDDCEFLFTPFFDDWSAEDFARFVYNADYAKVDPDYTGARAGKQVEAILPLLGPLGGLRILDYGAGAGIIVNGLCERGYDAHGYDPFSSPRRPDGLFDLVTCFEVIEHSSAPLTLLRDIRSLLRRDGGIMLGQSRQPPNIDEIRCNWWYCAPRNGHCSTFTARTLALAAERIGLVFHPGGTRHAFTSPQGGQVADLLTRITGPRLAAPTLGAPADPVVPGWHGIERPANGPFRWTASAVVTWRVPVAAPTTLDVRIPVRIAINPEFMRDCRILIDGREAAIEVRTTALVASLSGVIPKDGFITVELRTPELRSPRDLRGAPDDRKLGLGISVLEPPQLAR